MCPHSLLCHESLFMIKTLIIALAATLLGCSVGMAFTYWELSSIGDTGIGSPLDSLQLGTSLPTDPTTGRPQALVVGGTKHAFGTMEKGATKAYGFVFKNVGTAPLTLEKGETSCKCTLSDLPNGVLAPGESTEVMLKWTPKEYESQFSQTAEIHTNDPAQQIITLSVEGRVIESVRASPSSLSLGSVPMNEATSADLQVFSYPEEPLEITEINWGTQELASYFSAEVEPLPETELKTDPDAKTGKLVKVHVKPGLPLGPINQKIRLTTNFPELPVLEVPITITVTGDISIVGRGYVEDTNTLMLGRVRSEEGQVVKLNLLLKGPHRNEIEVKLGEVNPSDVLKVTLGEKVPLKDGALYRQPLEITIAPGTRTANYISTKASEQGLVVLETTHPNVKQIPIHVRFAVE